jgi:hypothetical protein
MAINESLDEMQEDPADTKMVVHKDDFVIDEIGVDSDPQAIEKETETIEPAKGMEFDGMDDAMAFYQRYAQKTGFNVKRTRSKSENEKLRYFTLACDRRGEAQCPSQSTSKSSRSTKTECTAKVNFSLHFPDNKFRITSVTLDHNHGLVPSETRIVERQQKPELCGKRRLQVSNRLEIHANKNLRSACMQAGGHENHKFGESKSSDNFNKQGNLNLGARDAHVLQRYFFHMQSKNPNFFYVMDYDEDSQYQNVFWADARSRAAYESFSDVVKFDYTYLTNKYDGPFASFMGVNHHGELTLLGCGILSNDDTENFVWLFKCWLSCMSNKPPKGIITDECKAMQDAVEEVFPETHHRWCLCDIMKKTQNKLQAFSDFENIKFTLTNLSYESLTASFFENSWAGMISKFGLQNNRWLTKLYLNRQKWVPAYMKGTFWAGICTKEFECENAFIDRYVRPGTTLNQFLEQYSNAVRDMVEKEKIADHRSFEEVTPCTTHYDMEKQFQLVYTNKKFEEFQEQLKGKIYCYPTLLRQEHSVYVFKVEHDCKVGEQHLCMVFTVWLKVDGCEVRCMCGRFESQGILCSHIISVLILMKFKEVPSGYVLPRWRKDLERRHTSIRCCLYDDVVSSPLPRRFDELCRSFYEVAEKAATSDELFKLVVNGLRGLKVTVDAQLAVFGNQNSGPAEHQDVEL